MAKKLIIYYSRRGANYLNGSIANLERGNTEVIVSYMQEVLDADLFQIETVKEYPTDYMECTEVAKEELSRKERPELKTYLNSLDGYDTVYICGPCWWGTYPMAMFTQLERLDWKGKKVRPLMTHEGSGLGSCERDLKKICKGASFGKGLAVAGHQVPANKDRIIAWARQ